MKITTLLLLAVAAQGAITVKHADTTVADTPYAEDQLQNAIDATTTVCGDIIEIDPGASRHNYNQYWLRGPSLDHSLGGPLVAPAYAKDCSTVKKYITIRSSQTYQLTPGKRAGATDVANLAFVGLLPDSVPFGEGCIVFQTERAASYWRLQGLNISAPEGNCYYGGNPLVRSTYQVYGGASGLTRLEDFPHHITIDQCWIHGIDGYDIRDGIQFEGISIELLNTTVDNIRTGDGPWQPSESHAFTSVAGRGPAVIRNNAFAAGQSSFFHAGFPSPTSRTLEYVELSNNWIYRPYIWMDWYGPTDPTPLSPCPVDPDGHGATYRNTVAVSYWECQGSTPGTWTQLANSGVYDGLIAARRSYFGKNLSELKSASRWHIEGNVYGPGSQLTLSGQFGGCLNLAAYNGITSQEEFLLIENNLCQHAGWGIAQGFNLGAELCHTFWNPQCDARFWANGGRPFHNILVRNNLMQHMGEDMYTHPNFGAVVPSGPYAGTILGFQDSVVGVAFGHNLADGFTFDHNTWQSEFSKGNAGTNTGVRSGDLLYDPANPGYNQRVTNNIFTSSKAPLFPNHYDALSQGWGLWAEMSANGFADNLGLGNSDPGIDAINQHCDINDAYGAGCPYTTAHDTYPPNCLGCRYNTPTNLKFTSYPNDLTLQSDSPLKGAGLDGKDLGADLNMVGWATAGAQAGTMAPYLAMKIRRVAPTATTVDVRFSAPDTTSCTVAARVYGKPLSSPTATATVNTGDLDRTTTLTGLTANTKYGLKVTCAGSYYREDEFRTP